MKMIVVAEAWAYFMFGVGISASIALSVWHHYRGPKLMPYVVTLLAAAAWSILCVRLALLTNAEHATRPWFLLAVTLMNTSLVLHLFYLLFRKPIQHTRRRGDL